MTAGKGNCVHLSTRGVYTADYCSSINTVLQDMPGKRLTNKQIIEAITLREAGFTLASIAQRLDISISSLQRAFKRHSVKRGSIHQNSIEKAREELLSHVTSTERIKEEAAKLVADDLAHSRLIREKAALTIESLTASNTAEAALAMRALVAYSTLIKNTTDTVRSSMGLSQDNVFEEMKEVSDLVITEMTAEEIHQLQLITKKPLD